MALPIILPFTYNILNHSSLIADNTDDGYDVLNTVDGRPFTFHKYTASSIYSVNYRIDYGASVLANSFAAFGHNWGTASSFISVQTSSTGAWAGEEVSIETTQRLPSIGGDLPLYMPFTPTSSR